MAKADGFRVMDVATDIHHDRKFGRIERLQPGLAMPAFVAYIAVMIEVRLVDPDGRIPTKVWDGWFERTRERRDHNRDRWRRTKRRVREDSARTPRGVRASSPVSVRPSVVPSSTRTERTGTDEQELKN